MADDESELFMEFVPQEFPEDKALKAALHRFEFEHPGRQIVWGPEVVSFPGAERLPQKVVALRYLP
jgi:hypothetical protein